MSLLPFRDGALWGFKDNEGRIVIAPTFDSAGSFSEGLARVKVKGKWGFINVEGRMVIEPLFEQARLFQQGYAKVKQGDVWGYTDASGLFVEHLDAGAFVDKTGEFISERDYKTGGNHPIQERSKELEIWQRE